jgi:general secretion pathway protein G
MRVCELSPRSVNTNGCELGFTLIEILVVMVIIGLLASVVGPNIVGKIGGAKIKTARLQVDDLSAALDLYYLELSYPDTKQGLTALITQPSDAPEWHGPYLRKEQIPRDPWGREYQYRVPGDNRPYELWSFGADGKDGGESENADITSWK